MKAKISESDKSFLLVVSLFIGLPAIMLIGCCLNSSILVMAGGVCIVSIFLYIGYTVFLEHGFSGLALYLFILTIIYLLGSRGLSN